MTAQCAPTSHWAHERKSDCGPWWENETEWHRAWRDQFPDDWQEVQGAEDGEKHIADVKTDSGWVLEFQHSPISPEERRARDAFYRKLVWVVDGTTRTRGEEQFSKAWEEAVPIAKNSPVRKVLKDPALGMIVRRGNADPGSLTDDEWTRYRDYLLVAFNAWEYGYYPEPVE